MNLRTLATVLTTVVAVPLAAAEPTDVMPYASMPEAVTSFGATVVGHDLYVFGGHMGRVAGSSRDGLSPHFCRLDTSNPAAQWQDLPMHHSSQSPGLVAWNGQVYRVGGLSFKNAAGEETQFESLAVFARFDPAANQWTDLPALPESRSSLDAAVVDGKLYAVGGWNLQAGGSAEAAWHDDVVAFDLANEAGEWTAVAPPPFQTRALAAVGHQHRLYVLGGMNSDNQPTRAVHVFDPQSNTWSQGPELRTGGAFGGFALAAFSDGEHLYYSAGDGMVYQLNAAGDDWQSVERLLFPRSFHRLVAIGDGRLIALGGIASRTYLSSLEVLQPDSGQSHALRATEWTQEFAGKARHSQVLMLWNGSLYAFGGNRSPEPHDFSPEAFDQSAFKFDLAGRSVTQLPDLPLPVQSGGAFVAGEQIDQWLYVAGGLSPIDGGFHSTDAIQAYRLRSEAWVDDIRHLPAGRGMFGLATHEGTVWIFGGSQSGLQRGLSAETWRWNTEEEEAFSPVAGTEIPVPRRSFGGTVLNGKYYAIGGLGANSSLVETVNVFDFATSAWSEIAAPQVPRVFPSLAAADGKLYLSGGFTRTDGHFAAATSIECYDPATNAWSDVLQQDAPRLSKMTMLSANDRLLFYSIDEEQAGVAHFVLLDPAPTAIPPAAPSPQSEQRPERGLVSQLMRRDKNNDGRLSADEVTGRFRGIVERADADQDGFVTREELETLVAQENPTRGGEGRGSFDPAAMAARVLQERDADSDGKLSGDELSERLRRRLTEADTDQDGALSAGELEASFRSGGPGRRGGGRPGN